MACAASTNAASAASTSAADDADDEDISLADLAAAWEGAAGPFLEDFLNDQGAMPNSEVDELSVLVDPEAYGECLSFDNGLLPRDGMTGIEEHGGHMQSWFKKSKQGLWRVAWRSSGGFGPAC